MTSSISADSGMVVITQLSPPAPAAAPRGQVEPGTALSTESYQIKAFLKGKPKVLGIKAALGMNVVSSVAAVLGICNYSIDIVISTIQRYCYGYYDQFCWGYVPAVVVYNSFSPAEVRVQNLYSETKDAPPSYTE
ncbi:hypothetical protein EOD39_19794 [Acipenser ruthenus]|uniref:Uncharacterized protein n=1 Tax=Acipenser ruthenus TaxID=7906 RepID=A0A444UX83_ACIRT|nr:hypothetical protein EOD39_19794 [Acipenser ruthenus]